MTPTALSRATHPHSHPLTHLYLSWPPVRYLERHTHALSHPVTHSLICMSHDPQCVTSSDTLKHSVTQILSHLYESCMTPVRYLEWHTTHTLTYSHTLSFVWVMTPSALPRAMHPHTHTLSHLYESWPPVRYLERCTHTLTHSLTCMSHNPLCAKVLLVELTGGLQVCLGASSSVWERAWERVHPCTEEDTLGKAAGGGKPHSLTISLLIARWEFF